MGRFKIINHHLVKDLQKLGLWRKDIIEQFVAADGSVQKIPEVPQDIKDLYKTVWEMSMKPIIDQAADRGPFIDQSQSLNLFVAMPDKLSTMHGKLTSMHFHAWKRVRRSELRFASDSVSGPKNRNVLSPCEPCRVRSQDCCQI